MRKLLNKPWFVALMAVAAVAFVVSALFSHGDKFGLPGTSDAALPGEASASDSSHSTDWDVVNKILIVSTGRDPFAAPIKAKSEEMTEKIPEPDLVDSVHVSAIWTQNGQTLVVINDRIYQGGDEIGRLKIESATQDGVWLSHWKGRDFVAIGGNFTLNTPASKFLRAVSSL